jgi:hypothetical protein
MDSNPGLLIKLTGDGEGEGDGVGVGVGDGVGDGEGDGEGEGDGDGDGDGDEGLTTTPVLGLVISYEPALITSYLSSPA